MILATSYEGYGLAFVGVPILILSLILLSAGLGWSVCSRRPIVARRMAVASIALTVLEYLLLCPWLSGGVWFETDSPHGTVAEYSRILMVGYWICLVLTTVTVLMAFEAKRNNFACETSEGERTTHSQAGRK